MVLGLQDLQGLGVGLAFEIGSFSILPGVRALSGCFPAAFRLLSGCTLGGCHPFGCGHFSLSRISRPGNSSNNVFLLFQLSAGFLLRRWHLEIAEVGIGAGVGYGVGRPFRPGKGPD